MKRLAILLLVILLPACATVHFSERPGRLFRDALFTAPTERISAADVFAVSDAMRHYLRVEIAEQLRVKGSQQPVASTRHLALADLNFKGIRKVPGHPTVENGDDIPAVGVCIQLQKKLELRRKRMSGENQAAACELKILSVLNR